MDRSSKQPNSERIVLLVSVAIISISLSNYVFISDWMRLSFA